MSGERWRTLVALAAAVLAVGAFEVVNHRTEDALVLGTSNGQEHGPPSYLRARRFPADAGADGRPVRLASGVELRPGDDGTIPVHPDWAIPVPVPEAIAVDRGQVYVAETTIDAFRLSDGHLLWSTGGPGLAGMEGLDADGGVVIGHVGRDTVRVFAPYNYDISLDRRTGRRTAWRSAWGEPKGAGEALPLPSPRDYTFDANTTDVVAHSPSGRVAWTIHVDEPMIDPIEPVAVPAGVVLVTSAGTVIRLSDR